MVSKTISSREFNQNTSGAKRAARRGPIFITDRGRPSHVLLSIVNYKALLGSSPGIIELLAMPGVADIAFDPPKLKGALSRPADLS